MQLTIDADSLDTGNAKRDTHLRSADFFDVEHHPQIRFVSDSAELQDATLRVHGQLHAAGKQVPLELDASVGWVDGEPEIEAVTHADHRLLGMMWSPLGILRAPSKLIVRGRMTPTSSRARVTAYVTRSKAGERSEREAAARAAKPRTRQAPAGVRRSHNARCSSSPSSR